MPKRKGLFTHLEEEVAGVVGVCLADEVVEEDLQVGNRRLPASACAVIGIVWRLGSLNNRVSISRLGPQRSRRTVGQPVSAMYMSGLLDSWAAGWTLLSSKNSHVHPAAS